MPVEIGGHKPPLRILRVAQDQEIAWHNSRKFGNSPKSDGGKRISALIPCTSYRMTANPINRISNGASGYYYGGGLIVPFDGGSTERAEFHYQCDLDEGGKLTKYPLEYCVTECNKMEKEGSLITGFSVQECIRKLCE